MFSIIKQIIAYTQSGQYTQTEDSVCLYVSACMFIIIFIVMLDWTRNLFRSLFNRLK